MAKMELRIMDLEEQVRALVANDATTSSCLKQVAGCIQDLAEGMVHHSKIIRDIKGLS